MKRIEYDISHDFLGSIVDKTLEQKKLNFFEHFTSCTPLLNIEITLEGGA